MSEQTNLLVIDPAVIKKLQMITSVEAKAALQTIIDSSRPLEGWISVKKELPEIGKIVNVVLKHSRNDVYTGFRANGGWYVFQIGEQSKYYIPNDVEEAKITHWQPLPNAPQP